MNRYKKGMQGEMIAEEFLKKKGYEILEKNFRCRFGEIDIIALDQETLVFAEVKYRKTEMMGLPEEAVTLHKQRRICQCALFYLASHLQPERTVRFDVIAILGEQITHFEHAFEFQK